MKKSDSNSSKWGFTIIEVSLVIAIAGLIFLMVFVALPSLRASQRDTERREHIATFIQSIKKYQTNNRGALPGSGEPTGGIVDSSSEGGDTTWAGFYRKYLGSDFIDPSGVNYTFEVITCGENIAPDTPCSGGNLNDISFPNGYNMLVVLQAKCSGEGTVKASNPRKLAVLYKLEGAGVYCDNT